MGLREARGRGQRHALEAIRLPEDTDLFVDTDDHQDVSLLDGQPAVHLLDEHVRVAKRCRRRSMNTKRQIGVALREPRLDLGQCTCRPVVFPRAHGVELVLR